jgi:hypothetical protein
MAHQLPTPPHAAPPSPLLAAADKPTPSRPLGAASPHPAARNRTWATLPSLSSCTWAGTMIRTDDQRNGKRRGVLVSADDELINTYNAPDAGARFSGPACRRARSATWPPTRTAGADLTRRAPAAQRAAWAGPPPPPPPPPPPLPRRGFLAPAVPTAAAARPPPPQAYDRRHLRPAPGSPAAREAAARAPRCGARRPGAAAVASQYFWTRTDAT